jgi:hypothetical protein
MSRGSRLATGIRMFDLDVKSAYKCKPNIPDQHQWHVIAAQRKLNPSEYKSPTEVGLEIEIEALSELPPMSWWRYENDGSLKDSGKELITFPYKDANIEYALDEFIAFLKVNKVAKFTHRCSMHVHINVSKLTVDQLYCLIATYIVFENLFFSLVREDRKGNSYCWPLADAMINRRDILPEGINEHFKYAALNVHHLKDYGTLEFRQHGGSKDKKELLNWIETILRLYSFVENNNPKDVALAIKNLNTISNYQEYAIQVFKDKFDQFSHLPLESLMKDNVMAAKLFLE